MAKSRSERVTRFEVVSAALSAMDDAALRSLVVDAQPLRTGIGGETALTEVAGHRVFIKKIPLTDLELLPANVDSTANLFDLPTHYHYGIGSAGFGAWRELAVHSMTTRWVLDGAHHAFPLTFHHRILTGTSILPTPETDAEKRREDIDWFVEHWDGSPQVRARLEAIDQAPARAAVFLEYIPWTLGAWLDSELAAGTDLNRVASALADGVAFMGSQGLAHFDAHRANMLTDGSDFYFADFGLALSNRFELTPAESAFLAAHADYDWVSALGEFAAGVRGADDAGPEALAVARRYEPAADLLSGYLRALIGGPKTLAYPRAEFRAARDAGSATP